MQITQSRNRSIFHTLKDTPSRYVQQNTLFSRKQSSTYW